MKKGKGSVYEKCLDEAFKETITWAIEEKKDTTQQRKLVRILQKFFTDKEVRKEVFGFPEGKQMNKDKLFDSLIRSGYKPESITGFNFNQFLTKFEENFITTVEHEPGLQGIIQIKALKEIRSKTEVIERTTGETLEIVKSLQKGIARFTSNQIEEFRKAYMNYVFSNAQSLSLWGIDPKVASDPRATLPLDAVYTALNTLSVETDRSIEIHAQLEKKRFLSVIEQLNRHQHLVLLGDPGSGKSTFSNFLALCLSGEGLGHDRINLKLLTTSVPGNKEQISRPETWVYGPLIPVRIILRDFAVRGLPEKNEKGDAKHLWDFIVEELKSATLEDFSDILKLELHEKGGMIIFDGLDEVPEGDQRREQIKEVVESFSTTYFKCKILVTSRTYAYQNQHWRLFRFEETILAPFNEAQINLFINHWYSYIGKLRGMDSNDALGRAVILKQAIEKNGSLQSFAERPLLLTLMASLHAWRGGSLPEKREQLYADSIDLLLDWWESPKIVHDKRGEVKVLQPSLAEWLKIDRQKERDFLNELAFKAHKSQPESTETADISEKEIISGLMDLSQNPDVKPARLIEYLSQRAGLLIPRGIGVYAFPHRTFQEYLSACYLTDHDYPYLLKTLVYNDPNKWREVALLACAKANRGGAFAGWSFLDEFCDFESSQANLKDKWCIHISGQAIVESVNLSNISQNNQKKIAKLKDGLLSIIQEEQFPPAERAIAGNNLSIIGDTRPEIMTLDGMQLCFVPGGPFFLGSDSKDKMAYDNEKPGKKIPLELYWISRFPLSNAQFNEFVNDDQGYRNKECWTTAGRKWRGNPKEPEKAGGVFALSNHPVVMVTWYEACAFTQWLSKYRLNQYIPAGWQFRLPTEKEWEKAARGGFSWPDQPVVHSISEGKNFPNITSKSLRDDKDNKRIYPWGDAPDPNRANYDETGINATSALGCFPGGKSPYGCEEMSGNVWEWCQTKWRGNYKQNPNGDPEGTDTRVLRGGSYFGYYRGVRCACRSWNDPDHRNDLIGFRIVLSPF
jgi:formylglycine-generating enzyme required for sulfatase activity